MLHITCHSIAACLVVMHIFLSAYTSQSELQLWPRSVQLLALSIQCNFWHSQFSATSGTLNSVQLLALSIQCNFLHSQPAVLRLHMAPNSQRHLYILLQSCFSTPTRPLRGRTGPPTHEVCKQVSQTPLQRTPFRVNAQNTHSMESTSTPSLQLDCYANTNQM